LSDHFAPSPRLKLSARLAFVASDPSAPLPGPLRLPVAPRSIQKGSALTTLLDRDAIDCLAHTLSLAWPEFDAPSFRRFAAAGLAFLTPMAVDF